MSDKPLVRHLVLSGEINDESAKEIIEMTQ